MSLINHRNKQAERAEILAILESAGRHAGIQRMGSSRISGQRVGDAGRQFPPHGSENDGGVVRPGRFDGLPAAGGAHSALRQRRRGHDPRASLLLLDGDVDGGQRRPGCWWNRTTDVRPRSRAIRIIRRAWARRLRCSRRRFWACTIRTVRRRCSKAARIPTGRSSKAAVKALVAGRWRGPAVLERDGRVPVADRLARRGAEEIPQSQVGRVRALFAGEPARRVWKWRSASRWNWFRIWTRPR